VDIREATPEAVRSRIGLVPQETVIFGTTARENIGYGRPGARDDEIEAAAKAAGTSHFLVNAARACPVARDNASLSREPY
jgi:ATP-binding cassette subfamily B protein